MTTGRSTITLYLTMSESAALIEHLSGAVSRPALVDINASADREQILAAIADKAQKQLSFIHNTRLRSAGKRSIH